MTDLPTVSVVIPCLNRANLLRPTIDSVLAQAYPHIECIVVDGGSTDGTAEILESYGCGIRWISEPDDGHADAINKGWKMSRGKVLAWLNADDLWAGPTAVKEAVEYLEDHPAVDVVYGDCGTVDMHGNVVGVCYVHPWDLKHAVEYSDHCIPQPAAFIRRSVLETVGWLDTTIFTKDRELWLRVALAGTIVYHPRLWAYDRKHRGISFDGPRVAPAIVQLIEKFLGRPGVPETLLQRRRRVMSNAYLRGMEYAWHGGRHWRIVMPYLGRALRADPTNGLRAAKRFTGMLAATESDDEPPRWLSALLPALRVMRAAYRTAQSARTRLALELTNGQPRCH